MNKLGISPTSIDILVLSHQHWDHIGGMTTILSINPDVDVYVPSSFSLRLKQEISNIITGSSGTINNNQPLVNYSENPHFHEVQSPQKICDAVYTTGEIGTDTKEQSLLIESANGLCILCGCAHSGLDSIIYRASAFGDPVAIIGGLHDSQDFTPLEKFHLIGAGHCTTYKEKIREMYPEAFVDISVGYTFDL
jgi:7,8-dihydropterin-6-yl-methyl-4-(beta-D-ribofuranosyl)aminobenzene 5'-phosphate synthase